MENIYSPDGKVPLMKAIPFGLQMIGACGFSQRNITIAALSLSIGLGFTQVPEMFHISPDIIRDICRELRCCRLSCGYYYESDYPRGSQYIMLSPN